MNNLDNIKILRDVLDRCQSAEEENRFLKRVLRQAVMTHDGELKIDELHAEAAKLPYPLDFGNGGVRFA